MIKRYVVVITDSTETCDAQHAAQMPDNVWVAQNGVGLPRQFPTIDAATEWVKGVGDWRTLHGGADGDKRQVSVHLLTGTLKGLQSDDQNSTVLTGGNIAKSGHVLLSGGPYSMDPEAVAAL